MSGSETAVFSPCETVNGSDSQRSPILRHVVSRRRELGQRQRLWILL